MAGHQSSGAGVLRSGRDASNLHVPETECTESAHGATVTINAGRKANRIGKANAHNVHGIFVRRVDIALVQTHGGHPVEILDNESMGSIKRKNTQQTKKKRYRHENETVNTEEKAAPG